MKVARKNYVKDWKKEQKTIEEYLSGEIMPKSIELEEAVLGAVMMDFSAVVTVTDILKPDHFYKPEHQVVFAAMVSLYENGVPIDLLTVVERLTTRGDLQKAGGPHLVAQLQNRVASTANIEYHCRILFQLAMRREGYKLAINAAYRMLDMTHDIFDTREELAKDSLVTGFNNLFLFRGLNQVMADAEKQPEMLMLAGSLMRKGEVQILFAQAGVGKSIFSMQIADRISRGEPVLKDVLQNECQPQKVLYFDFELTDRNILARYSDSITGEKYDFHENLLHVGFNPEFLDFDEKLDKIVSKQIEAAIIKHEPEVMIIDNITFLVAESPSDPEVAMRLMKKMMFYKRRYDLTILVLAHSPKRNKIQALEQKDLAGSAQLSNFADGVFAIGESASDPHIKYIKQVKGRSGVAYDRDNVISCFIEKDRENFLRFFFSEFNREDDHLADFMDHDTQDGLIEDAIRIKMAGPKKGWRKIAKEISWQLSHTALQKRCEQYAMSSIQCEFNPKERTFSLSNESITPDNEWAEGKSMLGTGKEEVPF